MKIVTRAAEAKLLEIVNSLRSHPDGYYGLHYHFSSLQDEFKSDYQIKIAVNILSDLFKAQDSVVFVAKDKDVFLLYHGSNRGLLEKAIFQLRYLFMDDPLGYTDDGFENEDFCSVYDLEFQWRDYFVACQSKSKRTEEEPELLQEVESTAKIDTPTGQRAKLHMLTPDYLSNILSELQHMDIAPVLRSQPICAIVKNRAPKTIFKEIYTNINSFQKMLLVKVDLMSSRLLFKYLTKFLDKKLLVSLKESIKTSSSPVSINMNVKTLLSEEFVEFDASLSKKQRSSIIIEIHVSDVFEDIKKFMIARAEVQKKGYRICLDGLDEVSFTQIDRTALGFDLAKISWSEDMGTKQNADFDKMLSTAVKKCGANRIILCHCGAEDAVIFGKSIGISLFQGRYVESLIESDSSLL